MKPRRIGSEYILLFVLVAALQTCTPGGIGSEGLKTIKAEDMKFDLQFLSAQEFRGRNVPTVELDIASKYIAVRAGQIGLKPLMPNGSFYQEVPVEVTSVSEQTSVLRLTAGGKEQDFYCPQSFSPGRSMASGRVSGEIVFLGFGLSAPQLGWDDYAGIDLKSKVAVMLDVTLTEGHVLKPIENRRLLMGRASTARERGAVGVVTIINEEREVRLEELGISFDRPERLRFPDIVTGTGAVAGDTAMAKAPAKPAVPRPPFLQSEVRHAVGAATLGINEEELDRMFVSIQQGKRVPSRRIPGRRLELSIELETRQDKTFNVVAYAEGSDPILKDEYLTISSHHDHLGVREGQVHPGSDDNDSGVVGMFEIAEAVMAERPKRSVIFVWNTAEEKGLIGSYYFVQHCPVPVEKISANLNLDMISRNDTNQIYLIGSNKLSTELDTSIQEMNKRGIGLNLDYTYEDPGHPDRFFFRSDQYPYIRYGIPGVWLFCGTTEDYHTPGDIESKADYSKMERISKLVYLVAMDVGNKPRLLILDVHPEIKERGKANMRIDWRRAKDT